MKLLPLRALGAGVVILPRNSLRECLPFGCPPSLAKIAKRSLCQASWCSSKPRKLFHCSSKHGKVIPDKWRLSSIAPWLRPILKSLKDVHAPLSG